MPTYDYKCKNCNDTFEHFQSMMDEPLKICNKCGDKLVRLIGSGLAPVFKGNGFYQTDYKNNKTKETSSVKPTQPIAEKSETKDTKKTMDKKSA